MWLKNITINNWLKSGIISLLLITCGFGQNYMPIAVPFVSGNDTIPNLTQDTLAWRVIISGVDPPAWNDFTDYITAAEKAAETTLVYDISNESNWTWGEYLQLKLYSGGTELTSNSILIGNTNGRITVFVQPDTLAGSKTLYKVRVSGN